MTLEKGSPVQMLTAKLALWLARQEEWETILALPRNQRRAAERELATRMYAIPSAEHPPEHLSRKQKRQLDKAADRESVSRVAEQKLAAATALNDALAQSLAEEALASVRLDREGDGQTIAADPMPEVFGGYMEAEVDVDDMPQPDPEGDAKEQFLAAARADNREALDALAEGPSPELDTPVVSQETMFIETDDVVSSEVAESETQEEVEDEAPDPALD